MVSGFFNGDCLSQMKYLPNGSIDLICTDPPYPTTSRGNAGNSGGMLQKDINKRGQVFDFNNIDCSKYAPEFFRVLKEGGALLCNDKPRQSSQYAKHLHKGRFSFY